MNDSIHVMTRFATYDEHNNHGAEVVFERVRDDGRKIVIFGDKDQQWGMPTATLRENLPEYERWLEIGDAAVGKQK